MSILTVYEDASLCVAYNFLLKTHMILSLGICYEGISLTENQVTPFINSPIFCLDGDDILKKKTSIDVRTNESVIKAVVLHQDHNQEEVTKKSCMIQSYKYYRHNLNHYEAEYIKELLLYI